MVRALLDGKKTQTRRAIRPQPEVVGGSDSPGCPERWLEWKDVDKGYTPSELARLCPYGKPGDFLWARETIDALCGCDAEYVADGERLVDVHPEGWDIWRNGRDLPLRTVPSIHMPRWASRMTLELTEVRVERLQEISESDAIAEGVSEADFRSGLLGDRYVPTNRPLEEFWCRKCRGEGVHPALGSNLGVTEVDCSECDTAEKLYRNLWESINGPESWSQNPWCWCLSFNVHQMNVDEMLGRKAA
ncbi:Phage-related protein [Fimbriiglobus ruber]|uniref:Phage-related protein n=2 Tax=Fimbriiglobus ruber TaxID=1908690 RepID=A0A225DXQ3_9BACT|nr:Phage-related protein [Fimbriiglobus ruber]